MPPTVAQTAPAFADALAEASAGFALNTNAAWRLEYEDRRVLLPPLPPVAQDFVEEIHASKGVDVRALFQQLDDEWTRSVLFALPPIAPTRYDEPLAYKSIDARALFQQLDDEWTRPALRPSPPFAFDEWDWNRDFSPLFLKPPEAEPFDFAIPLVTLLAYDENDWAHRLEWPYAPQTAEQDLPSLRPAAPAAFDDGEGSRDFTEKRFWIEGDVLLGVPFTPSTAWLDDGMNAFAGNLGSLASMLVLDELVNTPTGSGTFGPTPRGHSARFGFSISSFR